MIIKINSSSQSNLRFSSAYPFLSFISDAFSMGFTHILFNNIILLELKSSMEMPWIFLQSNRNESNFSKRYWNVPYNKQFRSGVLVGENPHYTSFSQYCTLYHLRSKYFDFTKNQVFFTHITWAHSTINTRTHTHTHTPIHRLFHENSIKKETNPAFSLPIQPAEQRTQQHISTHFCYILNTISFQLNRIRIPSDKTERFTEKYTRNQSMRWVELIPFVFDKCGVSYTEKRKKKIH